jgi:hypothetical protein
MFQRTFHMTPEEHLGWDQMEFRDVLATLDSLQQAEEVGASQLTQPPPVWTQPSQLTPAAGGATTTGGGGRSDTGCCRLITGVGDNPEGPLKNRGNPA